MDFPCSRGTIRQVPSTFRVAWKSSINIRQHFVWSRDLSLTSINFLCGRETFLKYLSAFRVVGRSFINFRNLSMQGRPSVNFYQISVQPGDFPSTFVNFPYGQKSFFKFPCAGRPFINFR